MKQIASSILKTIAYADIFEYPLLEKEIWRYLIGVKTNLFEFKKNIKTLVDQKKIGTHKGYYFLKSSKKNILIREKRQKIAKNKFSHATKAANILKLIPSVWYIGISGALAMNNAPLLDDVDFFIITSPNSLWLTRFITTIVLDIFGLRRKPQFYEYANKICLNMFLSASKLSLPKNRCNLYTAHEIVQLKTLVNKYEVWEHFLLKNIWVNKYLPQAIIFPQKTKPFKIGENDFLIKLENFFKFAQIKYMGKRRTVEKFLPNMIQFHPQDSQFWIDLAYKKRLADLRISEK